VTVTTAAGTSATSRADQFSYGAPTVTQINPSAGPTAGGTTVTITGTGFTVDSGGQVRFRRRERRVLPVRHVVYGDLASW